MTNETGVTLIFGRTPHIFSFPGSQETVNEGGR
jgi:hypothetical protein